MKMIKIDWDRYDVSEYGVVFDKKIKRNLKPHTCAGGYQQVHMSGKRYYLHCVVAYKFIPNPYKKPEVNHKDLNKKNNHVSNLEWMTRKENMVHAHMNGVGPRKNSISLIDKVDEIFQMRNSGLSHSAISEKFGVSPVTIWRVLNKKTYQHVLTK